jgi:hypothetical protein
MKAYVGVDVYIHVFLTSTLVVGGWSASRPGHFTREESAPGAHCIGWVGSRRGLDEVKKRNILPLPGLELLPLYRRTRNRSLYRLRHRSSYVDQLVMIVGGPVFN